MISLRKKFTEPLQRSSTNQYYSLNVCSRSPRIYFLSLSMKTLATLQRALANNSCEYLQSVLPIPKFNATYDVRFSCRNRTYFSLRNLCPLKTAKAATATASSTFFMAAMFISVRGYLWKCHDFQCALTQLPQRWRQSAKISLIC